MAKKKKDQQKTAAIRNKKAIFRFELLEQFECGIVLTGAEVKSIRSGQGSLEEAFATIEGGEVWLRGLHIPQYENDAMAQHEPIRRRKLLLHNREIRKIAPKLTLKGLTLAPLKIYFNERGIAKVTIALARGKSHQDKRQDIAKREAKREMDRAVRRRR
jgi:SsrA-binding protein